LKAIIPLENTVGVQPLLAENLVRKILNLKDLIFQRMFLCKIILRCSSAKRLIGDNYIFYCYKTIQLKQCLVIDVDGPNKKGWMRVAVVDHHLNTIFDKSEYCHLSI